MEKLTDLGLIESRKTNLPETMNEIQSCSTPILSLNRRCKDIENVLDNVQSSVEEARSRKRCIEISKSLEERRRRDLEVRDKQLEQQETEFKLMEKKVKDKLEEIWLKEKDFEICLRMLEVKEKALEERSRDLENQGKQLAQQGTEVKLMEERVKDKLEVIWLKEKDLENCLRLYEMKEERFETRRMEFETKEKAFEERQRELEGQAKQYDERYLELKLKVRDVEAKEKHYDECMRQVELREKEIEEVSAEHRREYEQRFKDLESKEKKLAAEVNPALCTAAESEAPAEKRIGIKRPRAHVGATFSPYDFNREKSEDKFRVDQIWALYDSRGLPKDYAQVMKIESTPEYFKLHVALLQVCSSRATSSCCGIFTVKRRRTKVVSCNDVSHQVRAEPIKKDVYAIYPTKGEIWAIYKSFDSEQGALCDIVEVLEDNEKCKKVVVLSCVDVAKSIYRAPRSMRSRGGDGGGGGVIEIRETEFARFSHQIQAFKYTGEDSRWRGYWELDLIPSK